MQALITNSRAKIRRNDTYIRQYRNAVYWVAQNIDDYEVLKGSFMDNLYKYVEDSQKKQEDVDKDIKKEFKSQAQFLTNSNKKLNYQLQQMTTLHREDNLNIMKENCDLIESVAKLTESVKDLQHQFLKIGGQKSLDLVKQKQAKLNEDQEAETSGARA